MEKNDSPQVNADYVFEQLRRALETAATHPDQVIRKRAKEKASRWNSVIAGIANGELAVGSRTPAKGTPEWVTLEVAHGGFATGAYLAEGPLLEHEAVGLAQLPDRFPGRTPRERLNFFYLSDAGQAELLDRLDSGTYRIRVPEEAALLVVAWHLKHQRVSEALDLVETLHPWMHRLRFYPQPADAAPAGATEVHVMTAGEVMQQLRDTQPQQQVRTMNTVLEVWNPLYDRLVSLWLETVEGEGPQMERNPDGTLRRTGKGQPVCTGGMPCERIPSGWVARREAWLSDVQNAEKDHPARTRFKRKKSNFWVLRNALERCSGDPRSLPAGEARRVRHALAGTISRHGPPGSLERSTLRAEQNVIAKRPLFVDIAEVVGKRLRDIPGDEGVPSLSIAQSPVQEHESSGIPSGTEIPAHFVAKVTRALSAPLDELVALGVIRSSETLGMVMPQVTAGIVATGLDEPSVRQLYAQTYRAFRRRRSLLLVNLEKQIQLHELPWMASLDLQRNQQIPGGLAAQQALQEVARVALLSFPQTIFPNRFVRELSAVAERAQCELPLVEELAADIFMGRFAGKWLEVARRTTALLQHTLYGRYYDLPDPETLERSGSRWRKNTDPFASLCAKRAAEAGTGGSQAAKNGAVLEQAQILTTHNLAVTVEQLGLTEDMGNAGAALAERCLQWTVQRGASMPQEHFGQLRAVKNMAYAWRQALFFLSYTDLPGQLAVVDAVEARLAETGGHPGLTVAFGGLRHIVTGGRFRGLGQAPQGRRFLGWSCGRHWFLELHKQSLKGR